MEGKWRPSISHWVCVFDCFDRLRSSVWYWRRSGGSSAVLSIMPWRSSLTLLCYLIEYHPWAHMFTAQWRQWVVRLSPCVLGIHKCFLLEVSSCLSFDQVMLNTDTYTYMTADTNTQDRIWNEINNLRRRGWEQCVIYSNGHRLKWISPCSSQLQVESQINLSYKKNPTAIKSVLMTYSILNIPYYVYTCAHAH